MSLLLATAKPAVQAAPMIVQHTFPQLWAIFWSWLVGGVMGLGLMSWFKNRGISGMVTDVKNDITTVKADVQAIQTKLTPATTPAPVA